MPTDARPRTTRLLLFALGGCVALGCGSTPTAPTADPGPPDARWEVVAPRRPAPIAEDPGVLACVEPERHSFQRRGEHTGWADRCGWRRHTTCVERCPLILASCSTTCTETTPRSVARDNLFLHVRRLFAAVEGCREGDVALSPLDEVARREEPGLGSTRWRALGCGKRGRFVCPPSERAPSGFACERMVFEEEAASEVLDEARAAFRARGRDRAACADDVALVGGRVDDVTLPGGEPGLSFALRACGDEVVYACVRPDLVAPDRAACREVAPDPAFVAAARAEAAAVVEAQFRCRLAPDALTLARDELLADRRRVRFAVTTCNATRDVRAVECSSESLVDARVRGCRLDSEDAETRRSRERAREIAGQHRADCGPERNDASVVSSQGDSHVVLVRCYGERREATFVRCRRDIARDGAECEVDAALQAAADALERAARERFEREERCPATKTTTQPIEGRPGRWQLRGSGCGVTRDYYCVDLAEPIVRCTLTPPRNPPRPRGEQPGWPEGL